MSWDLDYGDQQEMANATHGMWDWRDAGLLNSACGLAFEHGRVLGNLELRQVLLDKQEAESSDETIARLVAKAVLAEREACAKAAESHGLSRPPANPGRQYQDRHLGECAASSGIAATIRARGQK